MIKTFINRHFVGPDLGPNRLILVFVTSFVHGHDEVAGL